MQELIAPPVSSGLSRSTKPRVLGNSFGDGYNESVPDGINAILMSIEPKWSLLTFEEGDDLNDFFNALVGARFLWKLPREAAPRVWKAEEHSLVENRTTCDFSVKLKEQPS